MRLGGGLENPQKLWQRPGRNEAVLQRHTVSQYDCQTIETVDPREMGMSPRISCWQKDTSQRGTFLPERFLTVLKNSSDETPDNDGPVMGGVAF